MLQRGLIDEKTYRNLEGLCSPTCGSCSFLGTANTMCCLSEALGMTIPDGALVPAVYAERLRLAEETGKAIVALVEKGIGAHDIITRDSLENAVRVLMATGGSTNAVLHLSAIAAERGIPAAEMMALYERCSRTTPHVAKVNPASKHDMEAFHLAGGIPRVMKEIRSLLHTDCVTVTGSAVGENLDAHVERYPANPEIIRPMSDPFGVNLGLAVLRGNLAPDTAITKPAAIDPSMRVFSGAARVFDGEDAADEAILAGKIPEGTVVVIRYEGPKGGPGMREMFAAMKYLYGMGLAKKTALVTDGRFSGTNNGCFVGHVLSRSGGGRAARDHQGRRPHHDRHPWGLAAHRPDRRGDRRTSARLEAPRADGEAGLPGHVRQAGRLRRRGRRHEAAGVNTVAGAGGRVRSGDGDVQFIFAFALERILPCTCRWNRAERARRGAMKRMNR